MMSTGCHDPRSPRRSRASAPAAGFTLIEIMATLGILALLAGLLAVSASQLINRRSDTPVSIFWEAVNQARRHALTEQTQVYLTFDNEEQVFRATTGLGTQTFPLPANVSFELEFLGMSKGTRSILIGGTLLEANTIPGVTFYDDGTCSPFRAQLLIDNLQPTVLEVDPWTCAPVLRDESRN